MSDLDQLMKDAQNTKDYTGMIDPQDAENNVAMGVLSYLSFLFLIPLLAAKDSKFARFHVSQGLNLFIVETIGEGFLMILGQIPVIGIIFSIVGYVFGALMLVLTVLGIVNAVQKRAKELPVIGQIHIMKWN